MIAIVQRVTEAKVVVGGRTVGAIGPGLVALVSVHVADQQADVEWMAGKLLGLRIFRNGDKHFDVDVREAGGGVLLVSNFTVAAQTRKGRRPSFDQAAGGDVGQKRFDELVELVRAGNIPTATGEFGADMKVSLTNDGPATFILDSREKPA